MGGVDARTALGRKKGRYREAMGETPMNGVEKIHASLQCEARGIRRGLESINSLLGWTKSEREFAVGDDTNRSFQQSEQQIL